MRIAALADGQLITLLWPDESGAVKKHESAVGRSVVLELPVSSHHYRAGGSVAAAAACGARHFFLDYTTKCFFSHACDRSHASDSFATGLAAAQLLRLQAASGFGLRFYDVGVALIARHQGLWFGGAFGRWVPLLSPRLVEFCSERSPVSQNMKLCVLASLRGSRGCGSAAHLGGGCRCCRRSW